MQPLGVIFHEASSPGFVLEPRVVVCQSFSICAIQKNRLPLAGSCRSHASRDGRRNRNAPRNNQVEREAHLYVGDFGGRNRQRARHECHSNQDGQFRRRLRHGNSRSKRTARNLSYDQSRIVCHQIRLPNFHAGTAVASCRGRSACDSDSESHGQQREPRHISLDGFSRQDSTRTSNGDDCCGHASIGRRRDSGGSRIRGSGSGVQKRRSSGGDDCQKSWEKN
jgi:hypothetical protein